MKKMILACLLFSNCLLFSQTPAITYPVDLASVEHEGVPKGEILAFTFNHSKIFPGTTRECKVYVPAQYDGSKPACVYINQDGVQWNAPVVFDNLINNKEMPVTIGVFITPGKVMAANSQISLDRFNRSFEYDGLGDGYARFILDEILPEVEKQVTRKGLAIRLSKDRNDRAIGGSSSGAICAFTAAWERPEAFSRVFSAIGTYVGLRGGDRYNTLIRKTEPKAIRIFLQDGSNDLNIYAGDWWKANESMERSFEFAGYEVNHVWGQDGHNGKHGTSIFPDVMRWLWKDWPKVVQAGNTKNPMLNDILVPGSGWELVGNGYQFTEGTAADKDGNVFFQDIPNAKTYAVNAAGKAELLLTDSKKGSGSIFGADGRRYVVCGDNTIRSYDAKGKEQIVVSDLAGNDIVAASNGNLYISAPDGREKPGKLYLVKPGGEKILLDEGIRYPNGVTLTPDQTQLYVTESTSHWVWIYSIMPDGTLANKQRYGWLHVRDTDENAWSDGIKCDTEGRVYVATRSGIQVMDQIGRVNAIIPVPGSEVSNLCFGGRDFDELYISCRDKVYRRKVKVHGANGFSSPLKPANPKL